MPTPSAFQHTVNLPDAGQGRAGRIQAQLAVDVLSDRIVDARDHPRDVEDLAGDLGGHDVPVVAVGERGKALRLLDARLAKHVLINTIAQHHLTREVRPQTVERAPVDVDDGDLLAVGDQHLSHHGSHPAASHDDHPHGRRPIIGTLPYIPSARRAASISGSPAARILAWVVGTSYATRWNWTAGPSRSTTANAASGTPSRGWPTLPGFTSAGWGNGYQGLAGPSSGITSSSIVRIRGKCVCPKKHSRPPRPSRISLACPNSRMYSQIYGLRG